MIDKCQYKFSIDEMISILDEMIIDNLKVIPMTLISRDGPSSVASSRNDSHFPLCRRECVSCLIDQRRIIESLKV